MAESEKLATTDNCESVIAVVVTYNRKVLLRECIEALLAQSISDFRILIVDNDSTDGTFEFINDILDEKRVFYRNTGENLGGAGGFNFGIKEAIKIQCDYIWLMDDDCIVNSDCLSELLRFSRGINSDFGFLSSVVKWTDGSICQMNVQRKSISRSVANFQKEQKIMLASFVSLFLNVKAVLECGLPIKEFFIWGDDWEYTNRISREFNNYLVPESVVIHKTSRNAGVDIVTDNSDKLQRYFYAYRNEKYFYSHIGIKGKLYHCLKILYHKLKLFLSKVPNKTERLRIMNKGLQAAKSFKPQMEYVDKI